MNTSHIHIAANLTLNIDGRNRSEVIAKLRENGVTIGRGDRGILNISRRSLGNLMNAKIGSPICCDLNIKAIETIETVDATVAPVVVNDPTPVVDATLPPVQVIIDPGDPPVQAVSSDAQIPHRKGTKTMRVLELLCEGATVEEIAYEIGWTVGGASSVVYWDPVHSGYELLKEQVEGRGTVIRLAIKGEPIGIDRLAYTTK